MQREDLDTVDGIHRSRNHHSALACRNVFGHVETETTEVRLRARGNSTPLGLDCVRAILDNQEIVLVGNRADAIHIARSTGKVHRNYGPCTR